MSNIIESHLAKQTLAEWLYYLENLHSTEIDLGLKRIGLVAQALTIDLSFATVITVAGTNGKGTTCAFIENALLSENKTVAVYSSPHIDAFNERLRINQNNINDEPLINAFEQIEVARGDISLTYYEYTTLAAFLILQQTRPDVIILEVGLGGRLDATNIIDADIAVITTIDLDHQQFLGDTRELIGIEKAGIMRADKIAIIGEPDIPNNVIDYANYLKTKLTVRERDFTVHCDGELWSWHYETGDEQLNLSHLIPPFIPQNNVATAIMVLNKLNVSLTTEKVNTWISTTKVAGRTELIKQENAAAVLLDVGHNPQAARYLKDHLSKQKNYSRICAVVAMLKDKDIRNTLAPLVDVIDHWYIGSLAGERAEKSENIAATLAQVNTDSKSDINCFDNVHQAYKMAQQEAAVTDLILVFGSFLTVSEIRRLFI